ncbi:hypothetical protein SAMN05421780_105218 [Flexibacter flexilis DSM 6793]|uniref:Uncharacterized protein n=1 Tax=Flexibacter flexilis DSM 6793 TaxID=927664 RepID=A0A1I1J5N7_9BACT|nr:hypothetical protein [Flexibacter flexilis]SFC43929.1 hypothetical protein SAMN05421780_105218 [Flexibacter flexilis DSM 6793]
MIYLNSLSFSEYESGSGFGLAVSTRQKKYAVSPVMVSCVAKAMIKADVFIRSNIW